MAIVLPRGILKNYNDEYIRRHIIQKARIVAVIGLSGDMFKPFTNTKTCVLIVQKREIDLSDIEEFRNDPPIVYCSTEKPGKNKSGELILDTNREILSDLPEIATFIKENAIFL
jgi:type I restriction enzyme M protein